jgi:predicted transcriptional regulator of viral defense system
MELASLIQTIGEEPLFETSLLLAGKADPNDIRRQISRWVKAGKLYQLRRGLYALAPPYQKIKPHPFVVANQLVRGSYVSGQSALAHHGLIPEYTPVTTSVSAKRPARWQTPLGDFTFRHIKPSLLRGYKLNELGGGQKAFVASPAKALLDLIHLQPAADSREYLRELRLQNLERLDTQELIHLAEQSGLPKWERAAKIIVSLAQAESKEYESL